MKLVSWTNINNLQNIRRKNENDKTVILTWKDDKGGYYQIFKVQDCDIFIN